MAQDPCQVLIRMSSINRITNHHIWQDPLGTVVISAPILSKKSHTTCQCQHVSVSRQVKVPCGFEWNISLRGIFKCWCVSLENKMYVCIYIRDILYRYNVYIYIYKWGLWKITWMLMWIYKQLLATSLCSSRSSMNNFSSASFNQQIMRWHKHCAGTNSHQSKGRLAKPCFWERVPGVCQIYLQSIRTLWYLCSTCLTFDNYLCISQVMQCPAGKVHKRGAPNRATELRCGHPTEFQAKIVEMK